ncbi:vitelline membrane outer layer protein 1-like [Mytilus edulis]|uniref:vitelline membrane outer layer protein 1-like n=1 Tax=Mytilus edulis TaxID=6550 RepID=UPI0039EFCD65
MTVTQFFLILSLVVYCESLLITHDSPRNVVKVLQIDNGDDWGTWNPPQYCADGHFAMGYNMKIEVPQGSGDDTALNSILLKCGSAAGQYGGYIVSGQGTWGGWVGETLCENTETQKFLTSFALQVENRQGGSDDTAANFAKFKCRDLDVEPEYDLAHPPGHGEWGSYGAWSQSCPLSSAICGIQTRVESPQGSGDDTALNDVKFYCCSV